jgi:hypothetical protein
VEEAYSAQNPWAAGALVAVPIEIQHSPMGYLEFLVQLEMEPQIRCMFL